jgi:peptide/nickel transport system permease protein
MIGRSYIKSALEPVRLILTDRLAVTGLTVLSLIILMALLAPLVATHNPRAIIELEEASVLIRPVDAFGEPGDWRLEPPLGEVAISGAASIGEEAMAVGREGTAYWFDGERWSPLDTPFAHDLYAVALKPDGRALAVGEGGAVFMRGGGGWEVFEAPESINLFGVAWLDEARALLVGAEETLWLLDLNSPRFTVLESPVGRGLTLASVVLDIDGTALAVGERGLALRVTPEASVELERLPTFRDLNHVAISPAGNALIVGERGTLVRRVDNDWVEDAAPDTRALRAGWIGDEGHALAVGRNGVVLEYDGEIWTRAEILTERHFRAAIVAGDTAFALGSDRFVNKLAPPSGEHLFGTDHLGRDLFSQNVYGSRVALLVGFIGALLVVLIGANVGLIAGYYRGRAETFLMRRRCHVRYSLRALRDDSRPPLRPQSHHRHSGGGASYLAHGGAAHPQPGALPLREALRQGCARGRRFGLAHHVPAHLPQRLAPGLFGACHHRRRGDHRRGHLVVPGLGAAAEHLLGRDLAQRSAFRRLAHRLVVEYPARPLYHAHGLERLLRLEVA